MSRLSQQRKIYVGTSTVLPGTIQSTDQGWLAVDSKNAPVGFWPFKRGAIDALYTAAGLESPVRTAAQRK